MSLPGRLVLLGHPVSHSLSPAFQNAALKAAGIPLTYEALDVSPPDLPATVKQLTVEGAAGNVTVPHKVRVTRMCGELSAEAKRTSAVNTFKVRGSTLVGHNTDVAGFDHAARQLLGAPPTGLTVGILGAGGAAAAVLAAVESWPNCRALVSGRSSETVKMLVESFGSIAQQSGDDAIATHADLVVNATPVGMGGDTSVAFDPSRLRRATAVLDLVYSRDETPLVRAARSRGLRSADGLSMLVAQGAAAFEWWFGRAPDLEAMWHATGRERPAPA